MNKIIENLRSKKPIIHCLTNYVTVNDCANALLAVGASPIMADELDEMEDIISLSSGVVINIGTLNSTKVKSMLIAGQTANKLGKPVILDPVGVGASEFRKNTVKLFLEKIKFTAIRGNFSEIRTLFDYSTRVGGVDVSESDKIIGSTVSSIVEIALTVSKNTGAVIAVTGENDVIAFESKYAVISNGVAQMADVTGTGCMLTAVSAAFLCSGDAFDAMVASVAVMGICGERAYKATSNLGTGSMRVQLIDELSKINDLTLKKESKIEYNK